MENNLIESRGEMSFHLDGQSEIDASLLSNMITDMVELTKLTAIEVNPDAYLKMNVTAFKNGSFQIDFSAVCQIAESIFNHATPCAALALTVISGVKGIFEIKKLLKGEKAKAVADTDDGFITVEAQDGKSIKVPKQSEIVMNVKQADQLVTNISMYAKEHNPDGGFLLSTEEDTVYCSSEDISGMVKTLPIEEITTCQRFRVTANLPIRKAIFRGHSKWGFELNGRAIEAAIEDEAFIQYFQENESVKSGDYINANVEVLIDIDSQGSPIKGSERYTIIRVNGGIQHNCDELPQEIIQIPNQFLPPS